MAPEIAAQRRLIAAVRTLEAGENHEVRRMVRAASERPPARYAISSGDFLCDANRTRATGDEGTRVGEQVARRGLGK